MRDQIISIHIPKTAGTSFYNILTQVYDKKTVSPSFKRKDIIHLLDSNMQLTIDIINQYQIVHGHFYYKEVKPLIINDTKLITWVRNPIERLISNYFHFLKVINNEEINPIIYSKNKHRINESIIEYAENNENINKISQFLQGSKIEEFTFIGIFERYKDEINRLKMILKWPNIQIPHLNINQYNNIFDAEVINHLKQINKEDIRLYLNLTNTC